MEEQLVARYVNGLRIMIRDEVEMQRLWRLSDAYQLALKVEAKIARSGAKRYFNVLLHSCSKVGSTCYNASGSKANGIMNNASKLTPTNRGGQSSRTSHPSTCFKCKQVGHHMNECPNKQANA
ncbi:unnamed protein product [Musa hybrid cultivar]